MLDEVSSNTSVSEYAYRHFQQLVAAYDKEYSVGRFLMSNKSRGVVEVTSGKGLGRFFYTSSDELYFHSSRILALNIGTFNEFIEEDAIHYWIKQFMQKFKHIPVMSSVTKRVTYNKREMVILEELYRVYWVKHDKSEEIYGFY